MSTTASRNVFLSAARDAWDADDAYACAMSWGFALADRLYVEGCAVPPEVGYHPGADTSAAAVDEREEHEDAEVSFCWLHVVRTQGKDAAEWAAAVALLTLVRYARLVELARG